MNTDDVATATYVYGNVAVLFENARQIGEAVRLCRDGLQFAERFGAPLPRRGPLLGVLAFGLWELGQFDEALDTADRSLAIVEKSAANGQTTTRANLVNALWRRGLILGSDSQASLGRKADAIVTFQRAMDIADDAAQKDAADYLSRHNVAKVALEIGDILRHSDPKKALSVYDHGLARIHEAKSNVRLQQDEARLLASSSYAARWFHQNDEARRRIDAALVLVSKLKQYPAATIAPFSEADYVLRAEADHDADTGEPSKAVETYGDLLSKIMASQPNLETDLRDATCVVRLWTPLAAVLRRMGRHDEAASFERRRAELLTHWTRKLPNNPLAVQQIAATLPY
jgi:tetratricopeptide (TPR) repeat protein